MRFGLASLFLAAAVFPAILPMAARAETAEAFQRDQAGQKNQLEAQLRQSAQVDKAHASLPVADILSLHVEHGNLVLRSPLPDILSGKLKIGDDDDWTTIIVHAGATDSGKPVVPGSFELDRWTFSSKQTETLSLQQYPGNTLVFSLQDQTPAGSRTVQLQEIFANVQTHTPNGCHLTIMEYPAGQPWTPVTWSSDNFSALLLEHPVEVDRYLRPLLHSLDQEALLVPDPKLAFELFADGWTADAATTTKVNSLVADLSDRSFTRRNLAEQELAAMGRDAALVLVHLDRSKLDAEQNARVDKLVAPYHPVTVQEAAKMRSSPGCLANCLYSDDEAIRKAAFAQLLAVTKLPLKFDPAAGLPARSTAIADIFKQLPASKADAPQPQGEPER